MYVCVLCTRCRVEMLNVLYVVGMHMLWYNAGYEGQVSQSVHANIMQIVVDAVVYWLFIIP